MPDADTQPPELETLYARAFRWSSDAITISRVEDGVIVDANHSFFRLTGFDRCDVIGRSATDLGLYPDGATRRRLVARALERGGLTGHEVEFRTRSGQRLRAELSADIVAGDGAVHLFAIGRDITERHAHEQALLAKLEECQQKLHAHLRDVSVSVEEGAGEAVQVHVSGDEAE